MTRPKKLNKLMNKAKSSYLNLHEQKQLKQLHEKYLKDLAEERERPKLFGIL